MKPALILNTLLAAAAANAVFYLWGRHAFMPLGLMWVSVAMLGILLLLLAVILRMLNGARPDPGARLTIRMSFTSALVCFALLPAVPLLHARHRADLAAARARAEALAPALERHLRDAGRYPETLEAVAGSDPLPWLLRERDAYRSTGTGYLFQIRRPGHPFAAEERRHTETRWRAAL